MRKTAFSFFNSFFAGGTLISRVLNSNIYSSLQEQNVSPDWSQIKLVAQKDDITYTTVDVQYDSTEHINCWFASNVNNG